jgi:hypothetical protein
MDVRLFVPGGLLALMVSSIGAGLILAKLKPEGYHFSDLFYPAMYVHYWDTAPQRGWSRAPVYLLLVPPVYSILVLLLIAVC